MFPNLVYNFSHRIDHMSFGDMRTGLINALDGTEKVTVEQSRCRHLRAIGDAALNVVPGMYPEPIRRPSLQEHHLKVVMLLIVVSLLKKFCKLLSKFASYYQIHSNLSTKYF